MPQSQIAVLGHVEHCTVARVPSLPVAGEIVHLDDAVVIAGGGGGIAFWQLQQSDAEVHLYTAIGNDDAGAAVAARIAETGARIHAAQRNAPHTRDIILVTPGAERTIFVVGRPLHPERGDALDWGALASCDAAYFTAQDPAVIEAARAARLLVVTARRRESLVRSGVRADVVVGSMRDPLEASTLADYPVAPGALVMTDGAHGGTIETADGMVRFPPGTAPTVIEGTYGAGDSFAGALTWYLAHRLDVAAACVRAAEHGAAVLRGANPLEHQLRLG